MLTHKETVLKVFLKLLSALYLLLFILLVYHIITGRIFSGISVSFAAACSVLLFAQILMCWYAINDLRRYSLLLALLVWCSMFAFIAGILMLLIYAPASSVTVFGLVISKKIALLVSTAFNFIVVILCSVFRHNAEKASYRLEYFSPSQFKTLCAMAEVIIEGDEEVISPEDTARNIDTYFKTFRAKSKWTMALVVTALCYYPILSLKPPLHYISPQERLEFLKKRFYRNVEARLIPEFWRVMAQALIRIGKQMCYIGYYNDERVFPSIGYIPFSKREDTAKRLEKYPLKPPKPLYVETEKTVNASTLDADVVIVGSGAAASILAKGLLENGRQVLMVERGDHVTPDTYNENEMDMVSRLYADGAVQAARDFRFTIFQGSCVGGTTVVNNAVCFKTPPAVIDRWNSMNAGLNKQEFLNSNDKVWDMIGVEYMNPTQTWLNKGGNLFMDAVKKRGYNQPPHSSDAVNANIHQCLGCGYCNIGCKYAKKLSMLDTILPELQEKYGRDNLKIIAGCEAVKLHKRGNKISYVECRFNNKRKLKICGKTFVVSAGAISSSILLLKSRLGIKNAGKKLSFNMGSQMTAAYPFKVDSYDGLQISHYLLVSPSKGFIMETWFNPPMFQSTAMPGWFKDHYRNMRRYDRLGCVGLLVGSESNAEVRVAGLTAREVKYKPSPKDFSSLLDGLVLSGELLFESGAESVMPNTFRFHEFKSKAELQNLKNLVKDPSEITLGTGHPQGGNIIGASKSEGAVNPELQAFDYNNLFVCDASVFPTSVGVNPQISVMAMADYAVKFIKENKG